MPVRRGGGGWGASVLLPYCLCFCLSSWLVVFALCAVLACHTAFACHIAFAVHTAFAFHVTFALHIALALHSVSLPLHCVGPRLALLVQALLAAALLHAVLLCLP